jgi:hypothetical protein
MFQNNQPSYRKSGGGGGGAGAVDPMGLALMFLAFGLAFAAARRHGKPA